MVVPHTACTVVFSLIAALLLRIDSTIPGDRQRRDAGSYVATAQNLALEGVYGTAGEKHMSSAPLLSATGELTDHRAVRQVNLVFIVLLPTGSVTTVILLLGASRREVTAAILKVLLTHVFLLENSGTGRSGRSCATPAGPGDRRGPRAHRTPVVLSTGGGCVRGTDGALPRGGPVTRRSTRERRP